MNRKINRYFSFFFRYETKQYQSSQKVPRDFDVINTNNNKNTHIIYLYKSFTSYILKKTTMIVESHQEFGISVKNRTTRAY